MMTNSFIDKLNDYEKEMYKRQINCSKEDNNKNKFIISPLNDLIRFNPFQYEPYYKLLKQNEYPKTVYIADEVGAGKTIETGIVLTELIYNKEYNIRRDVCLIICPNLLCRKWRDTLKTLFGLDASIVYSLKDIHIGINIVSFDTISDSKEETGFRIGILIVDEAHNASGDRFNKVKSLRDSLDEKKGYIILLSATPLSGDKNDIEKQIQLLRPNMVSQDDFFSMESNYLCKNKKLVMRYAGNPDRYKVSAVINNHYVKNNALMLFAEVCKDLFAGKNTLLQFQGLNKIMSSPIAGVKFIDDILFKTDDELLQYLISSHEVTDTDDESEDDYEEEFDSPAEYTIEDVKQIRIKLEKIKSELEKNGDKKLSELINIINDNREKTHEEENDEHSFYKHIIVFTDKLTTARYLEEELKKQEDVSVFRVTGELFESEKRTRLQQYENENEKMSILIITNVACEGQDMDYGNTIVNYDLDYNPVRLEQRRGRIDRFEVKKNKIYIHNFMVDGFDYNPENQGSSYHVYSKVKKIWDKIQSIYEFTGSYYEIIDKDDNVSEAFTDLEKKRTEVFEHIYEMIGEPLHNDEIITNSGALQEVVIKNTLTHFGKYSSVYDLISDRLNNLGELKIEANKKGKINVITPSSNQDFLQYLYNGGTLISHLILGEK